MLLDGEGRLRMKLIISLSLAAWAVICAGAYRLADARIAVCGEPDIMGAYEQAERNCILRAMAVRDDVLLWGPAAALVALLVLSLIFLRPVRGWRQAGRADGIIPVAISGREGRQDA